MKKLFSALLFSVMMVVFVTPVFAVEGEGSASSDVEYVVEGSFTWSVPAKITVSTTDSVPETIEITSNNLSGNKKIMISLVGTANYNNGLNLKKTGDNTLYPYELAECAPNSTSCGAANGIEINSEPTMSNPITILDSTYGLSTRIFASSSNLPTTAGTYTDTLTFSASIVDAQ